MISYRHADLLDKVKKDIDGSLSITNDSNGINFTFCGLSMDIIIKIINVLEKGFGLELSQIGEFGTCKSFRCNLGLAAVTKTVTELKYFLGMRSSKVIPQARQTSYIIDKAFMDAI